MVYQDCKYRMPCGWCDRHNRLCDIVSYEMNKKQAQCDHEWVFYKSVENTGGKYTHYRCCKCGTMMMRDDNNNVYESGEWKP